MIAQTLARIAMLDPPRRCLSGVNLTLCTVWLKMDAAKRISVPRAHTQSASMPIQLAVADDSSFLRVRDLAMKQYSVHEGLDIAGQGDSGSRF